MFVTAFYFHFLHVLDWKISICMKTLTVFTPAYNRKHTITRTFDSLCRQTTDDFEWLIIDDGSSDGTREWVEGLGTKKVCSGRRFDWMGRIIDGDDENHFVIQHLNIQIEYIYKQNGGLYTGYNVAFQTIQTELCVCIDSDDFMPDDAVEKILNRWRMRDNGKEYCGVVGLDFNVVDKKPIGGFFPSGMDEAFAMEIPHVGDTKYALRTDLMKRVTPQIGFEGEKDFNPHYMQMQVLDKYPVLVANDNFCWVEYQIGLDSMSQGIWKQYMRSPRSYAKYRLLEMMLKHGISSKRRFSVCIHYVSSCIFSKDREWLKKSPLKIQTLMAAPFGVLLAIIVFLKNR